MTSYSLNLPIELKQKAEKWATQQGIPLEEFILEAITEKLNSLSQPINDPTFPHITYRRSVSGQFVPILRGTNLRVQTLVIATQQWGLSSNQIATEYDLSEAEVNEALAFYNVHHAEIDEAIAAEQALETAHV